MKQFTKILVFVMVIASSGCTLNSDQSVPSADKSQEIVKEVADWYWEWIHDTYPETSLFSSFQADRHDGISDNSLDAIERRSAINDSLLSVLNGIPEARLFGTSEWITYSVLKQQLSSEKAIRICKRELWNVNQMWSWHTSYAQVAERQPIGSPELRRQSIERWSQFDNLIDQEIANLQFGLRNGYSAPKSVVARVIAQIEGLINLPTEDSPYYSPALRDSDEAFMASTKELIDKEIVPALTRYNLFLEEVYKDVARDELSVTLNPNGSACYEASIRQSTSTAKSGAEIFELGRATVDKNAEIVASMGDSLYGVNDVAEIIRRLKNDPTDKFNSREEVLAFARESVERARLEMPNWVSTMPSIPAEVVPFEDHLEGTGRSAHYRRGNDERPGEYRIPLENPEDQSRGNLEITAFHEIWPGHHLQIATSQEIEDLHPVSTLLGFSGFIEGWGRYSEALAEEMNLYQTKSGPILRRAWPARGMVVDPGIHLFGWTRSEAKEFMRVSGRFPDSQLDEMVDRIAILPGQLTSYDTGGLEIMALRHEAEQTLGDNFSIQEFHYEMLKNGSLPLVQLRVHIENWIANKIN